MLRWLTAGESHGPALSAIIEGVPAHVQITSADLDFHLARRRLGVGRGARQNFEADQISILGGIRHGVTQGGPISIQVGNTEWPKWEKVMSADPSRYSAGTSLRTSSEVRATVGIIKMESARAPIKPENPRPVPEIKAE